MYRMDIAEVIELDAYAVANSYLAAGWLVLNTHTRADTLPMDNGPLPTQTTVYVLGRPRAVPPGQTDAHRAAILAAAPKPRPLQSWRQEPPPVPPRVTRADAEGESIDDIPF